MARPVNPDDYPKRLRAAYRQIEDRVRAEGGFTGVYPGSIYLPCRGCGIRVGVGPRSQETLEEAKRLGMDMPILCPICIAAFVAAHENDATLAVHSLGNTFKPFTP